MPPQDFELVTRFFKGSTEQVTSQNTIVLKDKTEKVMDLIRKCPLLNTTSKAYELVLNGRCSFSIQRARESVVIYYDSIKNAVLLGRFQQALFVKYQKSFVSEEKRRRFIVHDTHSEEIMELANTFFDVIRQSDTELRISDRELHDLLDGITAGLRLASI